jgi:transcriptional regulator with XRE-family HTH domain
MNFFASNMKYLRKKKGLTQSDLANKMGINRPKIGSYEEGRAEPKLTTIQRISHFYKVNIDDLLELDLSKEQHKEKDVKGSAIRILPIIVDKNDEEQITVVPAKASAGYLNGFSDVEFVEQLPTFNLPVNELSTNRSYRIFQIQGDSMLPVTSGSYIISEYVQNWETIKDESTYIVISQSEGIVYKRIKNRLGTDQVIDLKSDNTLYPTFTIPIDEVVEVWKAKGVISFNLDEPDVSNNQLSRMNAMLMELQQEMKSLKSK